MLKIRATIEAIGRPKELVTQALKDVVKEIKERHEVINEDYSQPKKTSKTLFTAFVELTLTLDSYPALCGFVIDYMPTLIEVLEPDEIKMDFGELEEGINELINTIHTLDKQVKVLSAQNLLLQQGKTIRVKKRKKSV